MRDIIEIINLLDTTKLKNSGVFQYIIEQGSKMERLYEALVDGRIKTDDDAKSFFSDGKGDGAYIANLKSDLKDRLVNTFFLLDFKDNNYSGRQKAYYDCQKRWAVIMVLLTRNAKISGIDLAERLLRHTIRFEFTELTLDILRVLRLQYSVIEGDIKKYEQICEQYDWYEKVWLMESKAERYYANLISHYTNSKATQIDLLAQANRYYEELAPFMSECESFKLHLMGNMIRIMTHNIENDYVRTAEVCEEVIVFFAKKDYDSSLPIQVFYYNLITCYLQLRAFEKGQAVIDRCSYYFEEWSFNWFKLQELFFMLAVHTQHYEEAYILYAKVMPKLDKKYAPTVEMWRINQLYLCFLVKTGHIQNPDAKEKLGKMKINRLVNDITLFAKDKRGMNITVLIAQILFALVDKNYDQTVERIDAIEKYCTRYLNRHDTYRSNCFIKMLLVLPLASFHREGVIRKTERYQKMLIATPLEAARQAHEIEIVPYEDLWGMIVNTLNLKLQKFKRLAISSSTQTIVSTEEAQ